MYKLTLKNEDDLTLDFNQVGGAFTITQIDGLSPAKATINTSPAALLDGEKFNSSKVNMRIINMAFAIETEAEKNRLWIYQVVRVKRPITLYYKSDLLDVFIEGYVQSCDISHFSRKQVATVSIVCPAPYFKSAQEVINELTSLISTFHFPFASTEEPELVMGYIDALTDVVIENLGAVECGLTFELYARDAISNPKIYNYDTNEFILLNFDMRAGDLITINTERGHKSVSLLRDGQNVNLFNCFDKDSTWLTLAPRGSVFVYEVGTGVISNLTVTIKHYNLFEGV